MSTASTLLDRTERLQNGADAVTLGAANDRATATKLLMDGRDAIRPYDPAILEQGAMSDRGSERMRADLYRAVEEEASGLLAVVTASLAARVPAIESLAGAILAADDLTLSGDDLTAAIDRSLAGRSD
jgi:hypothetical protein